MMSIGVELKSTNGFLATYERTRDVELTHVNHPIPFQSLEVHYIPESSVGRQDIGTSSWTKIIRAAFDDMTQLPGLHLRIEPNDNEDIDFKKNVPIDSVWPWLKQLYGNHTIFTQVSAFPTSFAPVDHQLFRNLNLSSAFSNSNPNVSNTWKAWMYLTQSMLPSPTTSNRYPFPSNFGTIRDIPGIINDVQERSSSLFDDEWIPIMSSHVIHCSDVQVGLITYNNIHKVPKNIHSSAPSQYKMWA